MPTQNVSASELLSAMPFPTASPPTVQSSVSICVSYKLCVGKDTICRQIDVSPILDRGVVSPRYHSNKKKRNSEKHTKIFLEFLVFLNKQIKGKSKNEKNYLHGKAPNKQKKNKEIFLDFLFSTTTKHA